MTKRIEARGSEDTAPSRLTEAELDVLMLHDIDKHLRWAQENDLYPRSFSRPLSLQLELTSHCNLECSFCYNRSGPKALSRDEYTSKEWVKLAPVLALDADPFQVILSGGEPFLYEAELPQIMEPFAERGAGFVLITNGWFLTEQSLKWLSNYDFYWIQVSIDSLEPETHDRGRGKKGSWERATRSARLLAEAGFPLEISATIAPEEIDRVGEFIDFAASLGAVKVVVGVPMPSGRAIDNRSTLETTPEDRDVVRQVIESKAEEYRDLLAVSPTMSLPYQLNRYSLLPPTGCIIRPNGSVRLDCMAPFLSGNIRTKSFAAIWRNVGSRAWDATVVRDYVNGIARDWDGATMEPSNYVTSDRLLVSEDFAEAPAPLKAAEKGRVAAQFLGLEYDKIDRTAECHRDHTFPFVLDPKRQNFGSASNGGHLKETVRKSRLEQDCLVATGRYLSFSFLNRPAQWALEQCSSLTSFTELVARFVSRHEEIPKSRIEADLSSCVQALLNKRLLRRVSA